MLEGLRQNKSSVITWILFLAIIAAFVLFFGQQVGPDMLSCGGSKIIPLKVQGTPVKDVSFRYAYELTGQLDNGRRRAFDALVERELLAQAAEDAGFRVGDEQVNEWIKNGEFLHNGIKRYGPWFRQGAFDYEILKNVSYSLGGLTVETFIAEQKREHLANLQRELLATSVTFSDEETQAYWIHEQTLATIDYLKFDVADYARTAKLSDADVDAYLKNHEADVKKEWELSKARLGVDKDWVRARHLLVKKGTEADAEATARAKAEALHTRLTGGADFAKIVDEADPESATLQPGGNLGWRAADSQVAGKALSELVEGLSPGQTSKVIQGPRGFHIVKLEARKKGALTYDDVSRDLALGLAPRAAGRDAAKKAAEEALARIGKRSLSAVYARAPSTPEPQLTPEQYEMIMRQLQQQGIQPADVPLQFKPPAPGSAPTAPAPAPAPADKSETGAIYIESENIPAQDGPAAPPPSTPPVAPAPGASPTEPVAAAGKNVPLVQSVGPFTNQTFIAGVGESAELAKDLFSTLEVGQVAQKVYEAKPIKSIDNAGASQGEAFVIVELKSREQADMSKYDEARRESVRRRLSLGKSASKIAQWVNTRCANAAKNGKIEIMTEFLREEDEKTDVAYIPCETLGVSQVAEQLQSRSIPPQISRGNPVN